MTAPSAAPEPPSARPPLGRRMPSGPLRRPVRCLAWVAAAALLATAATGCVTVHGGTALIPSAGKAAARTALARYVRLSNQANTRLDPSLVTGFETGAIGAIDTGLLKVEHAKKPSGDPGYSPLVLSDTHYLIPRQRGWPKWFVTDSASNRGGGRWVLVFVRDDPDQAWRASYFLLLPAGRLTGLAKDSQGYLEAAPVTGSGLLVQPGELGPRYASYLQRGGRTPSPFAAGRYTSAVVQGRQGATDAAGVVTQYADQGADPQADPPVALRLANGGALVFFGTDHQIRQTVAKGPMTDINQTTKALMTGTADTSLTLFEAGEQVATVPAAGSGGQVTVLERAVGPISAHGA